MPKETTKVENTSGNIHHFSVAGQLLVLNPGMNEVDAALWAEAQKQEGVQRLLHADAPTPNGISAAESERRGQAASLNHPNAPGPTAGTAVPAIKAETPDGPVKGAIEQEGEPQRQVHGAIAGHPPMPGQPGQPQPVKKLLIVHGAGDGSGAQANTLPLDMRSTPAAAGTTGAPGTDTPNHPMGAAHHHAGADTAAPHAMGSHDGAAEGDADRARIEAAKVDGGKGDKGKGDKDTKLDSGRHTRHG